MFCFSGLGNPGKKYLRNRHNIGFMCIDAVKEYFSFPEFKNFNSELEYTYKNINGGKIYLTKPLKYMNNSGLALKSFSSYYKINTDDLVVIYDDVSINLAEIRIRRSGSDGGHNGMKSIINSFATDKIKRIRIGIGPKPENIELADFVLSNFTEEEFDTVNKVLSNVCKIVELILNTDFDIAISKYKTILG